MKDKTIEEMIEGRLEAMSGAISDCLCILNDLHAQRQIISYLMWMNKQGIKENTFCNK